MFEDTDLPPHWKVKIINSGRGALTCCNSVYALGFYYVYSFPQPGSIEFKKD